MPHGSYSLGEAAQELQMLRLRCSKCGRAGQYRIDRLIKQYGPDIALPDLISGTNWPSLPGFGVSI
jgi:hypothetical protein